MTIANDRQVGGSHYRTSYQHWDLAVFTDMGYLDGCVTKYVTRWRKKDGTKDLQKALHYLNKLIESYPSYRIVREQNPDRLMAEIDKFSEANHLDGRERKIIQLLCVCDTIEKLHEARKELITMLEWSISSGTPEDGGHHSKQADDSK